MEKEETTYWECKKSYVHFEKGKIYTDLKYINVPHLFKPSTKEAYDEQEGKEQPTKTVQERLTALESQLNIVLKHLTK